MPDLPLDRSDLQRLVVYARAVGGSSQDGLDGGALPRGQRDLSHEEGARCLPVEVAVVTPVLTE